MFCFSVPAHFLFPQLVAKLRPGMQVGLSVNADVSRRSKNQKNSDTGKKSGLAWPRRSYLSHHGLLVLFLLRDLDGRQLGDSRHQEVHQDVFAVGQLVHHALQTCG